MSTFQKVTSGAYVPSSTGLVVSIAPLPGGNATHPAPMRCYAAHFGNFGSGNPVGKAQVQIVPNGTWYDVKGASITNNGSVSFYAYGVAVRWSVPTLTAPGTGATAPRVLLHATNMFVPNLDDPFVVNGSHKSTVADETAELLSVPGFGRLNPDSQMGIPFKSLTFLTMDGAGTSFIEGTFYDGDGSFKIQESGSLTGASGQVCVESFAEEIHANYTAPGDSSTSTLWLDVFQVPI